MELLKAGRSPGDNAGLALEALILEIARRAKLAGLPHAGPQDNAQWSGDPDLDTEARALLAVQRLRDNTWVQTTAAFIVRAEHDRTTPANP